MNLKKILTYFSNLREKILKNKILTKVLLALSIVYYILLIVTSWSEFKSINWFLSWKILSIIFFLYFVSMQIQCLNWSLIFDGNLRNYVYNSEIYFKTALMKRLPGGFWHWLGRSNYYSKDKETPSARNKVFYLNFIEWFLLLSTGLCIYIWMQPSKLIAIIVSTVVIATTIFLSQKAHKEVTVSWVALCISAFGYLVSWLLGSIKLYFLLVYISPQTKLDALTTISTWTLSGVVGLITFFIPNIGIFRDFTINALLSAYLPFKKIVLLIVMVKIFFLLSEIATSLLSIQILKLLKKKN